MKIGIDASRAFQEKRTGIEEYSYQVIKHLRKELKDAQVVLYVKKNQNDNSKIKNENTNNHDIFILPDNWHVRVIKFPYLWTQIGLSLELLFHPVDVLFIPAHIVPIIHPKNTIVTIHGLEYEFFPEGYSFWARLYMRWSIKFSCRWAKKIIAVSENTKKDLVELYNVCSDRISVIYEGASNNSSKFEILNLKSNLNDKILNYKPYLLFVGRLEKRKNVEGIIEAFKILKEKYNIPHKLVLAGKPGFGYEGIMYQVSRIKYKDDIIFTGFVSEEEKWQLLKNANAFLFPTFYEGFGLPILEAQNLGVPVVTSNISSLPEVGGESVLYANPNRPEEIAEAAFRLISNQNIRDDIIKKGYENIKRFDWEKCASEIARIIQIYK